MNGPATLKKISEHLNISISTVSRALKDHPDVSAETKLRVKELAEMLDYEPNAFAVSLRKNHSNLFAVMVPEISNFFYHSFIQSVDHEARLMGYSIMVLQNLGNPETEAENLKLCRTNHVAGLFVALGTHGTNYEAFQKLQERNIPVVFFDIVPETGVFEKVCLSDYEASWVCGEKLAKTGATQMLALLGSQSLSITHRRESGFKDSLQKAALPVPLVVYCDNQAQAQQQVLAFFSQPQPYTGIFCMSDETLCGCIKALQQLNLQYPNQVSLICLSNGFIPTLFHPMVDYVETSGSRLGVLAFARMKSLLVNKADQQESFLSCPYFKGGSLAG
ncbi:MAG: LacI family transcriptional regulator [Bacteroidetes bacterium]|nr:MAG: LacI family transcriptional regulator [Bacteroidota bacterium]